MNIIRSYTSKPAAQRGQPNYKKLIWEYFEDLITENPNFEDSSKNEWLHEAIIRGNLKEIQNSPLMNEHISK